jgi:predicted DNA-binding transcriptional regulator AlpA
MHEFAQELAREIAPQIAKELAKVLKAENSETSARTEPVALPRLTANNPKFLTQKDLATMFNVTTRAIYNWRTKGNLPRPRLMPSGRWVWREDEIEAWMATRVNSKKG